MEKQKLEEVKFYDKINLKEDWIAWPEDVSVFVKALLPYIKNLENRIVELEDNAIKKQSPTEG